MSTEAIHERFLRALGQLGARGDVLDFGAGTGLLTERLLQWGQFTSVSGADLMARPASLPPTVRWYHQDLNRSLDAPSESFDVLVACEIIEHLENSRALVREWWRLLRPGGRLVLSTPNNESFRSLIALFVRGHFVAFGDTCYPAHITALLRKDIERLLAEAQFIDTRIFYTDDGGLPGWPATTWQKVSGGLLRGKRWSDGLIALASRPQ
jgi:2-polyprenyl-3-methyl-5-hydroxy-6-metoxy-1,4-benzoquinol methylase